MARTKKNARKTVNPGMQPGPSGKRERPREKAVGGNIDPNRGTSAAILRGTARQQEQRPRQEQRQQQLQEKSPQERRARKDLLVTKKVSQRLCREIGSKTKTRMRIQAETLSTINAGTKAFVIGLVKDAISCATHEKRTTIMARDVQLARRIRGDIDK